MKIKIMIICLLLICSVAWADNNVVVHINYPADTAYIGAVNILEVWLENDLDLHGMTLGFEFTTYAGEVIWDNGFGRYPPIQLENDMVGAWDAVFQTAHGFDNSYLPDSLEIGAVRIISPGLPTGSMRKIVTAHFSIPSGESIGEICIDNIYIPPNSPWFIGGTYNIVPDYFGCVNASQTDPDCPAVCFPVAQKDYLCGDVDNDGNVTLGDPIYLVNYIFAKGPAPLSVLASDAFCNGRLNMADVAVLVKYLFGGGNLPCDNCP